MGGICGIVRPRGGGPALAEISLMTGAMAYRGPDAVRHWRDGNAAFGHCLLRTTEEAVYECQPLLNDDGSIVLVMDGTLWNASELRQQLRSKGAVLRNPSDGELVLRSFEVWGRGCLDRMDGDFAFAVYDRRSGEVICARDRIGMRPLHWHHSPECGFCFASDPEALLLLSGMPRRINEARIADCLIWGREGSDFETTFHSAIKRLPPAHALTVRSAVPVLSRYWTFQPGAVLSLRSDGQYEEAFRSVLSGAVERRLRGRETTGATLSGGLDSSTVCALARRAGAGGTSLRTYSAVGPDPQACLETRMIAAARDMGGLTARSVAYHDLGNLADPVSTWLGHLSNPFDRHMSILAAVYALASQDGYRAVLDAAGADTVLHEGAYLVNLLRRGRWLKALSEATGESRLEGGYETPSVKLVRAARQAVPETLKRPLRPFLATPATLADVIAGSIIRPDFARATVVLDRFGVRRDQIALRPSSQAERAAALFSPAIAAARERYERTAAAHGIEARDPYLDLEVIRFCLSLPPGQLARGGWSKHIVRRAMHNELPDEVRWRGLRTHLGVSFSRAILHSARTQLMRGAADAIARLAPYIDAERGQRILNRCAAGADLTGPEVDHVLSILTLGPVLKQGDCANHPFGNGRVDQNVRFALTSA